MTALVTALLNVPAGTQESAVFAVPNGVTTASASLDGSTFPVGVTTIEVLFSYDSGVTFPRSAMLTASGPITPLNGKGGVYELTYGTAAQPTNVKFRTNAPSAFSTQATLSIG